MEVDVLQTLPKSSSKTWLANNFKTLIVWDSAELMELSIKSLPPHLLAWIFYVSVPVAQTLALADAALTLLNKVWEVPSEVKHISVLWFVELSMNTYSLIDLSNLCVLLLLGHDPVEILDLQGLVFLREKSHLALSKRKHFKVVISINNSFSTV